MEHHRYMRKAIECAALGMNQGCGGPFGAVIVRDGEVIAVGCNRVTSTNDPTAHAEVVAIRKACERLGNFELPGCVLYTSCEPCPMCLGAIYWARLSAVYFACTREDAARAGFDDCFIYQEIARHPLSRKIPFHQVLREEALELFQTWQAKPDRIPY